MTVVFHSVQRVLVANYLEPQHRRVDTPTFEPGDTARGLEPPLDEHAGCLVWVNGKLLKQDEDRPLEDGDLIQIVVVPGIEAFIALHWVYQVLIVGALLAATSLVTKYLVGKQATPNTDPEGSNNNGFAGFRNSYEQGSAMPVLYGRHRIAGPVINQQISAANGTGVVAQTERLTLVMAISEGPILGIGDYQSTVATNADKNALVTAQGGTVAEKAGVQVNGQPVSNFASVSIDWRTGEQEQDELPGIQGTTQTATIEQELPQTTGIDQASFAPGVYTAGNDIQAANPGDSVEYQLTAQQDGAIVQFLFQQGIFGTSQGNPTPSEARFRIQYYATDAGGTRTGSTVVLPEITIAAQVQSASVFDFEFLFFGQASYTPLLQTGYHTIEADSTRYLFVENDVDSQLLPDNFQNGGQLQWSARWLLRPRTLTVKSPNQHLFFHASGTNPSPSLTYPFDPTTSASSAAGFWVRLVCDSASPGQPVRLRVNTWASGSTAVNDFTTGVLGNASDFNESWHDIGFTYDAAPGGGGQPVLRAYVDGVEFTFSLSGTYTAAARGTFATTARLNIGRGSTVGSGTAVHESEFDVAVFALFNGIKPASYFAGAAFDVDEQYGKKLGTIQTDEPGLRAGFNATAFLSGSKFANLAPGFTTSTTDGECFETSNSATLSTAPQSDSPAHTPEDGTPLRDYYKIQIFRSSQVDDDPTNEQNAGSVEQITTTLFEEFVYPLTSVLKAAVVADDQVNNQRPTVTVLGYGRIVKVWDGADSDFPTYLDEWTRSPAWIAMDMATNERYGLGGIFPLATSIDLPAFKAWADYCDEGVEDGFGTQTFYAGDAFAATPTTPNGQIQLKVGLIDSAGNATGNEIPISWAVGKTLGIKTADSATNPELAGAFVTVDADAKLEITDITYEDDSAAPDGFTFWAKITCNWVANLPLPSTGLNNATGTVVGFEARCMFDGVFDEVGADAWDQLIAVFQAGRAMPILVGNKLSVFVDRPRPPVAVITEANCIEGTFKLSYTGTADAANSYEIDYVDELLNYETVPVQVDHSSAQDETNPETFRKEQARFVGVVRRSQVLRDAHFRLRQNNELLRAFECELGLDSVPLFPGDRVRVAHDTPNYGQSGRLLGGPDNAGNFNAYPESFAANLISQGGLLDVASPNLEVAGIPTQGAPNSEYQTTGPLGYGSADLVRNTTRGTGQDQSGGSVLTVGNAVALQFYDTGLLPPSESVSVIDIIDSDQWEVTAAVFLKEPDVGAATEARMIIHFAVDASGASLGESMGAVFSWSGGVLSVSTTTGGATATVQAPGTTGASAGWYRAAIHMRYADITGSADVGDPYQVRLFCAQEDQGTVGNWSNANSGGKGVNFLAYGDPLDFNEWGTRTDVTQSTQTAVLPPPFYSDVDHGPVQSLQSDVATGTGAFAEESVTIQGAGSNFGGAGTVTGEDFTTTMFLRENTATDTRIVVGNASGNNVTVDIDWATKGITTTGSAGASATFALVAQNSTTNDTNWYQLTCTFRNAAGDTSYAVRVLPAYHSGAIAAAVYVWGIRTHGQSSAGTDENPFPHRGLFAWGLDLVPSYAIADYQAGTSVALDQDVTLEAGKTYELEVRSSTTQAAGGGAMRDNVPIDPSEVPSSGSTTIAAGTYIKTQRNFVGFAAETGDVYSFGETEQSVVDFAIVSLETNPANYTRKVVGVEYKDIYDPPADLAGVATAQTFALSNEPTGGGQSVPASAFKDAGLTVRESSYRGGEGQITYAATASWGLRSGRAGEAVRGVRVYVARKASSTAVEALAPSLAADVGRKQRSAVISSYPWEPGVSYRVYFQPYGLRGNARPPLACPYRDFTFYGGTRRPDPPNVEVTGVRGERGILRVLPTGDADVDPLRPENFEMRVGGWLLGQRITNATGAGGDMSDELFTGPTNTAGDGPPPILIRGRTGQGTFGRAAIARMTGASIPGESVLSETAFEDTAWLDTGTAALSDCQVNSDGHLEFAPSAVSSMTWTSDTRSLTYGRRVYVEFWVEGDAISPYTPNDLAGIPVGDPRFHHWTMEGPISGPEFDNIRLKTEWRHVDDPSDSLTGVAWEEFRPGVVFFGKAQFRFSVRRRTTNPVGDYQVRIKRAGLRSKELPSFRADGGTF